MTSRVHALSREPGTKAAGEHPTKDVRRSTAELHGHNSRDRIRTCDLPLNRRSNPCLHHRPYWCLRSLSVPHITHTSTQQVPHSNSAMILRDDGRAFPRRVQGRLPVAPRVRRSHTSALAAAWFAPRRRVSFRGQLSAPTMQILAREQVDTTRLAPRGFEPHSSPKRSCSPKKYP